MAAVKELLRAENDGSLSFGDYTLSEKTKKDNYEFEGDIYKVKPFRKLQNLRGTECSFMSLYREARWRISRRQKKGYLSGIRTGRRTVYSGTGTGERI